MRGDVYGPVLQVGSVAGDVNVHRGSPVMHVVEAGEPVAGFGAGAQLSIDGRDYVVHDHLFAEARAADGAVYRQARVSSTGDLGWLRQVDDRAGTGAGRVLAAEHALLTREHIANLPSVLQFRDDHRVTSLVVSWPRERSGRPSDSLHQLLDDGPNVDTTRVSRWFGGLASLCTTLGELHGRNLSHRALAPDTLIARDDGRLVLRDLGLAARPGRPGENSGPYRAPEQHRRGPARPGPGTDVYQVAAIAYRIVSGSVPGAMPPPVRTWHPAVPAVIDAALVPDAAARPDIESLGAALRDARHHIR
ncbi:MAG: hypothetical protein GEV28_27195 [Actinophytocola sp.]|nr:hypothetical protein [Actinophytocola sp.]